MTQTQTERVKLDRSIDWLKSTPFLLLHLAVVAAFFVPFSWGVVVLCLVMYAVRMFGVVGVYHRYFAHRSYKMGRVPQFLMAWLAQTSAQKGVLWWGAYHRHHHKFSDQPEDIHSPARQGFWWSHIGWILSRAYQKTRFDLIPDFAKYPELRWLNKYYLVPPLSLALAIFLLGGWPALVWGFVISTVLLWHGTFIINSVTHGWGRRRYVTSDTSRNSFLLSIVTLGEGWHNNHHCYQASANSGFFWWEFDPTYYTLKLLSWLRIVSDLKRPPIARLEARRIDGVLVKDPMFDLIRTMKLARQRAAG
ncbi:MAG: acyl-CoA desaturase [bacterium]|nr:acyl-CoA desaturase [bacterium]